MILLSSKVNLNYDITNAYEIPSGNMEVVSG